jgi:MFS family permease
LATTNDSQNRRFLLALLSIFQPLGVVVCSGIAYGFVPKYSCDVDLPACSSVASGAPCCTKDSNYGWRYLMFTLGGISFAVFLLRFVVFTFQESPQYLLSKGKDAEALKVLQYIAKFNKQPCKLTSESFEVLSTSSSPPLSSPDSGPTPVLAAPPKLSLSQKVNVELKRLSTLFATATLARLTILVWIIYAFDYWGFSVAGKSGRTSMNH